MLYRLKIIATVALWGVGVVWANAGDLPGTSLSTASLPVASKCQSSIGINIEGINYYSVGMPYVDLAKMSMGWIRPWRSSWENIPLDFDENGYLKTVDQGSAQTIIHDDEWGRSSTDSRYILLYDGEGELDFNLNKPRIISKKRGRIEVELAKGRLGLVQKSTKADDHLRNIRFIPKENEENYQNKTVRDVFINQWKGVSVMRYLDLQDTNHSKEVKWQDRKKQGSLGAGSSSIEDIIQIANETDTNPWLLAPHMADDDYFRNMALYVRDNLKPNLKIYIEYTNEAWNSRFPQAQYLTALAKQNNTTRYAEYGKRSLELFKIWEDVFGGTERLIRVVSTQFVNSWVSEQILATPGLAGHADALAVGYYFGNELGSPDMVTKTMEMTDDEILEYLETVSIPKTKSYLELQKNVADKYNLDLIAYEAGQHLVAVGQHPDYGILLDNNELTEKLIRINRNPKMKDLYLAFYDNWVKVGGDLLTWFATTGKPSKWGTWGLLEYMGQSPNQAPKYLAVQQILSNNAFYCK
ncbi:hypothetical protein V2P20_10750 [Methylobacter sp. Wu1]|uniref:hypothetical protein n=1 Tax=Methylobacter sp. Wu1 TaxID=3119359 RepID=UPI002F947A06